MICQDVWINHFKSWWVLVVCSSSVVKNPSGLRSRDIGPHWATLSHRVSQFLCVLCLVKVRAVSVPPRGCCQSLSLAPEKVLDGPGRLPTTLEQCLLHRPVCECVSAFFSLCSFILLFCFSDSHCLCETQTLWLWLFLLVLCFSLSPFLICIYTLYLSCFVSSISLPFIPMSMFTVFSLIMFCGLCAITWSLTNYRSLFFNRRVFKPVIF